MKQVSVTKQVNATADKIWNIVKTGDAINEWLPMIASCKLIGSGSGAKRICKTADGKTLEETIKSVDHANRELIYSIDKQEMMPIMNITNKLKISESMDIATIKWTAEFDMPDESIFYTVEQGLKGLFEAGINGLEKVAMANS